MTGEPGGERALAAWVETVRRPNGSAAASEVFARALDGGGRPRRRPVQISEMGADQVGGAHAPAVAYDSRRRRYVVVWYGDGPDAARQPCPQPGPVIPGGPPCRRADSEVYLRILDSSGRPLGPQRRITTTGPAGSTEHHAVLPSVVHDTRSDQYLMSYLAVTVGGGGSQLRAQRIAANGRRQDGSFALTVPTTGPVAVTGRLVGEPATGRRLLLYSQPGPSNGREVLARRLDRRGRPRGAPVPISEPGGAAEALGPVAFDRRARRFLVLMGDASPGVTTPRLSARLVGVDGRPAAPVVRLAGIDSNELALAPAGRRGWLLAFAKRTRLDVEVYARMLSARGAVTGPELRISQMGEDPQTLERDANPQEGHWPALAALSGGRLLAAWLGRGKDDREPEAYARPIRPAG